MINPLELENPNLDLLADKGPFSRARFDRLYTHNGGHWVDLWKENGAYLTGRRPEGVFLPWMNQTDKGLAGLFPTRFPSRLLRQVQARWPHVRHVLTFRSPERALVAGELLAKAAGLSSYQWADPARSSDTDFRLCLDRPWTPGPNAESLLIWPLLPWGNIRIRLILIGPSWHGDLPVNVGDLVSGAEIAGLIGALNGLRKIETDPKTWQALTTTWESTDAVAGDLFLRRGPYWEIRCPAEAYPRLFNEFFTRGFLLPPDPRHPAILPSSLSGGELQALKRAIDASKEASWT